MISLTCTSCKRVLEIDDAFAGGVCRCQHCGTIQTVPSSLKNSANPAGTGAKTLYQRQSRGGASTVAEAASGLSSSLPAAEPAPPRAPRLGVLPLAVGVITLLLVIIAFIFWAIA